MQVARDIFALFGAFSFFQWIYFLWSRRSNRSALARMLKPSSDSAVWLVLPTQKRRDASPNTPTTVEDTLAANAIQSALTDLGHRTEWRVDSSFAQSDPELADHDLVLVCGPRGNTITKALFELLNHGLSLGFKESSGTWAIHDHDAVLHAHCKTGDEDFALIARMRNPWSMKDPSRWVLLVAGLEGLGTWGAAVHVTRDAKSLWASVRAARANSTNPHFETVVHARKHGFKLPTTELRGPTRPMS